MYDERIGRRSANSTDFSTGHSGHPEFWSYSGHAGYTAPLNGHQGAGTGRHRGPTEFFSSPLVPPDETWDPAEELAFMLQDAMQESRQAHGPTAPTTRGEAPLTGVVPIAPVAPAGPAGVDTPGTPDTPSAPDAPGTSNSPLENLQRITAELPPLRRIPRRHRRIRERKRPNALRTTSHVIAALTAVIASSVSFFGGMVAYDPLHVLALARMQEGLASWWPLLVYGPWLVASLSVLRAALHRRRAVHSWGVVLVFSAIAMLLCIAQAPRTIIDVAAAALPGLASLACFQQLVRQVTLTRPPRRTAARHRHPSAPAPAAPRPAGRPAKTRPAGGAAGKKS
ncbi:hypothetical protein STXM2123_5797 [Streptomyces sp. F-3]|uniref:Integral membrane protein n=1 Tax=Streptomyces thermogriseus TaxID=75292 RepID=A0ABN1T6I4_9ACTN|nr:hypothetical protein STXM2123_5797 [Streptomyces sp. F-3]